MTYRLSKLTLALPNPFLNHSGPSSLQRPRCESNINVWFPFMYSQKWNCYFQNRTIIIFFLPVPTLIYLWEIYIFPGSVYNYSAAEKYVDQSWEYISQTHECWNWDWGRAISRKRIHFWLQCGHCQALCLLVQEKGLTGRYLLDMLLTLGENDDRCTVSRAHRANPCRVTLPSRPAAVAG